MSGWIKLEKDLLTDPRLLALAAKLAKRVTVNRLCAVTHPSVTVTLAYGALARLWVIGDTHIGEKDILALGAAQINQLIGIDGFCELLPRDWLQILDGERVKLPNFHTHNGTIARTRALAASRQERWRKSVTPKRDKSKRTTVTARNASALPDLDLDLDTKSAHARDGNAAAGSLAGATGRHARRAGQIAPPANLNDSSPRFPPEPKTEKP